MKISLTLNFIFFIITLFSSSSVYAHSDEKSGAHLQLLSDNQYSLTITVDVLHLAKQELNFSGDEQALAKHLNNLSLKAAKTFLAKLKQNLSVQTHFYFDGMKVNISPFSGLSIAQLRQLTRRNMGINQSSNQYKAELYSNGALPKAITNIQLRFAASLGNVHLTISNPIKILVAPKSKSQNFSLTNKQVVLQADRTILNIVEYIYQGFVHILPQGLDHILFVLALFLLATKTSTLLWQVSAFTLAHTITLALGIFGVINLPSNIVEPLIALSIAYVAIENIYQQKLSKWRLPVIFIFGLLHGLGFASVLIALGLPKSEYISSLISFNIGVEFGQVTVIVLALLATRWCTNKPWYRKRIVIPASTIISSIALYWFVERMI